MIRYFVLFMAFFNTFFIFPQKLNPIPVKEGTKFYYKSSYNYPVKSVSVAGSMNNWEKGRNKMTLNPQDSVWSAVIQLTEGIEYSYKLVINDSLWITDPNAPFITEDEWRNGLIVPQKYGAPFVGEITPAPGQRINYIPELKAILKGVDAPIDFTTVSLTVDGIANKFGFSEESSEMKAKLDTALKDGEHKIEIKFSDKKGNRNDNYTLKLFLDRYITEIKTPSFYDNAVMYEVYIRSFADGNYDGIGDFEGLTKKLDYLKNYLGVNTLWLMPFNESTTDHGYNVVDYYSIEKDYGTYDKDFCDFIKAAKKRGMKVLMDFVINHTDSAHQFFMDAYKNPASKYSKWYQFTNKDNSDWKHFGVERKMPKLDFENKEVQDYFILAARYWVDPFGDGDFTDGIDGFRCDAAKEVPHQFWSRFRTEMKKLNPKILLLGEVWDNANYLIPFYKEEFDMLFDYPLYYAMDRYFTYNDINTITSRLNDCKQIYPSGFQTVRFLANHDNNRAFSRFDDMQKLKQALFIIFTLPGTPMIYYGDEAGLTGKLPAENVRQKIDWSELEKQEGVSTSVIRFYKELIALRKNNKTLSVRDDKKNESLFLMQDESKKLLAYLRCDGNKKYLAVINNSGSKVDSVKLKFNTDLTGTEKAEEVFSSHKTKNKITFNISKDYIFLNDLKMLNGSFKLFELK